MAAGLGESRAATSEVDMTGAAIQALRAAAAAGTRRRRKPDSNTCTASRTPTAASPSSAGEPESNVASTAWAVQGIWAAGQNPETWVRGGNEPLSYMASLQQSDGHIRWKQSQDLNGVWMTAYVAPAFAGQAWPIPSTPCAKASRRPRSDRARGKAPSRAKA